MEDFMSLTSVWRLLLYPLLVFLRKKEKEKTTDSTNQHDQQLAFEFWSPNIQPTLVCTALSVGTLPDM